MSFRKLAVRRLAGALGLLLALSLVLVPASVLAVPQGGHVFYGAVTIEGGAAAEGTVITASVAGMEFITTVDSEGKYGYSPAPAFNISADDPDTPEVEGAEAGDLIEFYIGGTKAQLYDVEAEEPLDSYPFEIEGLTKLNLSIAGSLPEPLTAEAGGPYSGTTGASIALSGSASGGTEPYTYAWDLDNDSTYETPGKDVSHSWSTAATYTVGLLVTDNVSETATATTTVNVSAAPLIAEAGGPYSGTRGANIALSGSASGGTEPYTYAWDLDNDSTYETPGKDVSHSWSTAATYTIGLLVTDNVSETATDTATVTVTAPSGGGGVGTPTYHTDTNLFGTEKNYRISSKGEILQTIEATSADGMLTMTIVKGTTALGKDGKRLRSLQVAVDKSPPDPPDDAHIIGLAYDFGPDGATFELAITLEWSYDPDALPEGVAEADLVLAYHDGTEWVELDCVVDTVNNTITASVAHFTTFAIIGAVAPEIPALKQDIDALRAEIASLQDDLVAAEGLVASLQKDVAAEGLVASLQEDVDAAGAGVASSRDDLNAAQARVASLQSELATAESNLAAAQDELARLEAPPPNWGLIGGIIAVVVAVVVVAIVFFWIRRRAA